MIVDNYGLFSDSQAVTVTAASTSHIDLSAMGVTYDSVTLSRKIGNIYDIPFMCYVSESFATLTSLAIALQSDNDSAFGSATTIISVSMTLAQLTKGALVNGIHGRLPVVTERYVRMYYTVTGSTATAGKIFAGFVAAVGSPHVIGV